jgi:hypothetical protein
VVIPVIQGDQVTPVIQVYQGTVDIQATAVYQVILATLA